jgi:hypothetical protein
MTSFAVKRDIFRSFFPDILGDIDMESAPDRGERNQPTYNSNDTPSAVPQQDNEDTRMEGGDQLVVHHSNLPTPPQVTILPTEGMIQAQSIIRLPTSAISKSHDTVQISQMSPNVCKCIVNMSPDDFYALFIKLPPYNRVIFFEVATREVLFVCSARNCG